MTLWTRSTSWGAWSRTEYDIITPFPDLYATFDKHFQGWDPATDALRIAADFINDPSFPSQPQDIAERYNWTPRRLNPALSYLSELQRRRPKSSQ